MGKIPTERIYELSTLAQYMGNKHLYFFHLIRNAALIRTPALVERARFSVAEVILMVFRGTVGLLSRLGNK